MSETNELSQRLKDALLAEGSTEQAALLTGAAESLTKNDIINFINGDDLEKLTIEVKAVLRQIAIMRVKARQPLFPWNDDEFISHIREAFDPKDFPVW